MRGGEEVRWEAERKQKRKEPRDHKRKRPKSGAWTSAKEAISNYS